MRRRGGCLTTKWTRWPHTKAMHDLLVRYLGGLTPTMGRSVRKAIVLDAFAGPTAGTTAVRRGRRSWCSMRCSSTRTRQLDHLRVRVAG